VGGGGGFGGGPGRRGSQTARPGGAGSRIQGKLPVLAVSVLAGKSPPAATALARPDSSCQRDSAVQLDRPAGAAGVARRGARPLQPLASGRM